MVGDLISVIIPVYNREAYLRDCLDSVCGNTYQNLEIIIVNDGSTDKSAEIIDSYASRDKRIVVINQENGGVSSARNAALAIAKGDWIGFVDSDDWISRNYFETMINFTRNKDLDIVVCDWFSLNQRNVIFPDPDMYGCSLLEGKDANDFFQKRNVVWGGGI